MLLQQGLCLKGFVYFVITIRTSPATKRPEGAVKQNGNSSHVMNTSHTSLDKHVACARKFIVQNPQPAQKLAVYQAISCCSCSEFVDSAEHSLTLRRWIACYPPSAISHSEAPRAIPAVAMGNVGTLSQNETTDTVWVRPPGLHTLVLCVHDWSNRNSSNGQLVWCPFAPQMTTLHLCRMGWELWDWMNQQQQLIWERGWNGVILCLKYPKKN